MIRTLIGAALALACVSITASANTMELTNEGRYIEASRGVVSHSARSRVGGRQSMVGAGRHRVSRAGRHVHSKVAHVGLIRVSTAAGIDITVAPVFAAKIQGFISDLVARGYRPSRVTCFSQSRSHVRNSNHFWGGACDFNQRGWGKTDRPMYRVADLARKWGLRDGCTFRDCGHIDMPRNYARLKRPHYASALH